MHSIQWSECNALTMMYTCQCIEYNAQNTMHCIMKHIIHWQKYNAYKTIYIAMYRIEHKEYNAYNIMHKYNALNTMHRIQCIEYSA